MEDDVFQCHVYLIENGDQSVLFDPGLKFNLGAEFNDTLEKLWFPLAMAIEREAIYRAMESDRNKIYERSIRDPLTGLYSRIHMQAN